MGKEYQFDKYISQIFKSNKKKIAINIGNRNYTYDQLNTYSNNISNILFEKKVKKKDIIAIPADKNINLISSIFACLKYGCAYTILDFDMPKDRLNKIIKRCNPKIFLFSSNNINKNFRIKKENIIFLYNKNLSKKKNLNFNYLVNDNQIAYLMFTSGSTGFPKGAMISRGSLMRFIRLSKKKFNLNKKDNITNLNPIYFDNSIFDVFCSILNGIKLTIFSDLEVKNPKKLLKKLLLNKCTVWFSTPSLLIYLINLKLIEKKYFKTTKKIIFGGEGFPISKLKVLSSILKNKELYNVYGPTETTCICSSYKIKKKDLIKDNYEYVTVGKLWKSFKYILKKEKVKNKNNKIGELVLYGPNVGRGYINDPNQTKAAFIKSKNSEIYNGYKTGDLFRIDSKKNFYFKGRKDNQVKSMGHRIELNEIELIVNSIKGVDEAVVFSKKIYETNKIIVVLSGSISKDRNYLNSELRRKLPNYMIPSNVFIINKMLKNKNGKIDRNRILKTYEQKATL